jgi:hypothetical protein
MARKDAILYFGAIFSVVSPPRNPGGNLLRTKPKSDRLRCSRLHRQSEQFQKDISYQEALTWTRQFEGTKKLTLRIKNRSDEAPRTQCTGKR